VSGKSRRDKEFNRLGVSLQSLCYVEFTIAGDTKLTVRKPRVCDENEDGIIQKSEAIRSIEDRFSQNIAKAQAMEVVRECPG
jgi:hypothetical protein